MFSSTDSTVLWLLVAIGSSSIGSSIKVLYVLFAEQSLHYPVGTGG